MRLVNILGLLVLGIQAQTTINNPIIWADIPDLSLVRVEDTYYMVSTTMHMNPGVPIMESKDLVNWKTISYVYQTLANTDETRLDNGKNAYGQGSWAASIRYKNGTFYVLVPGKSSGKTHLWSSTNPRGPWKEVQLDFYHDPSLHLDDDGRNYIVHGGGDIRIIELNAELTGVKPGGVNKILITDPASVAAPGGLRAEGAHIEKIGNYYYVFTICWPSGWGRAELVHRSTSLTGSYEGRVALNNKGVAQGSVIQAPDGKWFGYLFQDFGSVGRSPWIMPVTWVDNWPVFNGGTAPATISMNASVPVDGYGMVTSDDFSASTLPLEWQWNHNPNASGWSLAARPGYLRLTTTRVDADYLQVRSSPTQRSYGPKSSSQVLVETAGLKDGDIAGLAAMQKNYGYVAVKRTGTQNAIVMINASSGTAIQVASVPLNQDKVHLRVDMDFTNRTDKATFYYSLDGNSWSAIGNTLQMSYTIPHFMGYRFALFVQATKTSGGYADFDHFKIGKAYNSTIPFAAPPIPQAPYTSRIVLPGTIQAEEYDVGGEGVAFHDEDAANSGNVLRTDGVDITGDATSGYKIGWTVAGEWLEYSIRVPSAGVYYWQVRVSSGGDGAAIRLRLDTTDISGAIVVPNTGDWDTYQTLSGTTPPLSAGDHVLRLEIDGSYGNIDWISLNDEAPTKLQNRPGHLAPNKTSLFDLLGRSQNTHHP